MKLNRVLSHSFALLFTIAGLSKSANAQTSPCPVGGAETSTQYSLYKEYFKQNNFDKALPYWREIYTKAPGFKKQAFFDGQVMFSAMIQNTEDPALKDKYLDTLLAIYDKRIECWGDKSYVLTNKAIDLWKYRPQNLNVVKNTFQEAITAGGNDTKYYAVANYFRILLELKDKPGGVTTEFIKAEYPKLLAICDANIAKADKESPNFSATKEDLQLLYKNEVLPRRFQEGGIWQGLSALQKIDSAAKWIKEDVSILNVTELYNTIRKDIDVKDSLIKIEVEKILLQINPSADIANNIGANFYNKKDYESATPYFQKAIELAANPSDKAKYAMSLADNYRLMNKFPEARDAARSALAVDSTLGKAYYLIGVMYMSSGKLCGPGTGFDSQRVLWPAFDYFNKAKALDPSLTETIDELMAEYKKYLPTKLDIANKKIKAGSSYFVPCWIQEEGTVRTKD